MSSVKQVKQSDFRREVTEAGIPTLVDFFAPWCGPCRAFAPALEGIANDYEGRVNVVKVDVDEEPQLAAEYDVQAVPTLMLFKGGMTVDTMVGVPSASVLRSKLDTVAAEAEMPCGVSGCSCCG